VAGIETVLVERLLERVDLRFGDVDLRLADLAEIPRRHKAGQQPDDQYDHQQF